MEDERKEKLQSAMKDEIDSFHENYTYDLVELLKRGSILMSPKKQMCLQAEKW